MAEFIKVMNEADLPPGECRSCEVNGQLIALFNVNGEYFALDNTCAHRGGPLGEGFVDQANMTVQCPWHGWVFNVGTGVSPINPAAKVEKFEVKVEDGEVKVALD